MSDTSSPVIAPLVEVSAVMDYDPSLQSMPAWKPLCKSQHSTYSELAANLDYMTSNSMIGTIEAIAPEISYSPFPNPFAGAQAGPSTSAPCHCPNSNVQPHTSETVPPRRDEFWVNVWPADAISPFLWPAASFAYGDLAAANVTPPELLSDPPPSISSSSTSTTSPKPDAEWFMATEAACSKATDPEEHLKKTMEPKKPKLACLFCRERKICCGTPEPDASDQRCK